ncbi:MAG: hypothetical protein ABIR68_05400 [Ilumatobacteraceae bacterium]
MADRSRRLQLLAMKLAALARDHGATDVRAVPGEFGIGAALLAGTQAWVLVEDEPGRGLGPAVAWSIRRQATELQLVAELATGTLARRAAAFTMPIEVWHVAERTLLPAIAEPLPEPPPLPTEHAQFGPVIAAGGATPVVEFGVLTGEVAGLEVCRVVTDDHTGGHRLDVGIGAHDREAFQLLHGDRPKVEAIAGVVAAVAVHRVPGAPGHPLNRLGRSRALRALLIADPTRIGATEVVPVDPPLPRPNVKDDVPCVAIATIAGVATTVVCSAGVDLDAVPFAVDARLATGVTPCLVVVTVGDDLPIQHELAAALIDPVRFITVDPLVTASP